MIVMIYNNDNDNDDTNRSIVDCYHCMFFIITHYKLYDTLFEIQI